MFSILTLYLSIFIECLPIACYWHWSVGVVEVRHILVEMKGKHSPNYKVTMSLKSWLKAVLKPAHG